MENTHDLGRVYCHALTYPSTRFPRLELGSSHEAEKPWRVGRCVVARVPFTRRAAVVGWWGPGRTYEELLAGEDGLLLPRGQGAVDIRNYRRPA